MSRERKIDGRRMSNRGQFMPMPPFAHKLLNQVVDAVRGECRTLHDPSWNTDYLIDVQLTVQECRALVELAQMAGCDVSGFCRYTPSGQLKEDPNEH